MANVETTSSSLNERQLVLSLLHTPASRVHDPLADLVEQHVRREERGRQALAREFEGILEALRGDRFTARVSNKPKPEMKWLRSQAAVIREELEHLKKKLEWKDNQITDLVQETIVMKESIQRKQQVPASHVRFNRQSQQVSQTSAKVNLPRLAETAESPDSLREMENVYQQMDRYIGESRSIPQLHMRRRRGSLAEVNLEPDSPEPPEVRNPGGRRNSKLDLSDLDILGTSSRSSLQSRSLTFCNADDTDVSESKEMTSILSDEDILKNREMAKRRFSRQDHLVSFRQEGRRPSLAELVTIYEKSHELPLKERDLIAN